MITAYCHYQKLILYGTSTKDIYKHPCFDCNLFCDKVSRVLQQKYNFVLQQVLILRQLKFGEFAFYIQHNYVQLINALTTNRKVISALITANVSSFCLPMEKHTVNSSLNNKRTDSYQLISIHMTITYKFCSDFGNFRGDFKGMHNAHSQFLVLEYLPRSLNLSINAI